MEKATFEAFLTAAPDFAGEPLAAWSQPEQDPPDVLCTTHGGRRVGLELTEWLDEGQIASAKRTETVEESLLKAVSPEPPNDTEHIHFVWLRPSAKGRMRAEDRGSFRVELLALIEDVDTRWDSEIHWRSPQGCCWSDFSMYPTLAKYLSQVQFFPRSRVRNWPSGSEKGSQGWLTFPCRGGAYSPDSMVAALRERIEAKIQKYTGKPDGVDEFHLLIHYDKAWEYNTPVEAVEFGFSDAAVAAADFIGNQPGAFSRIFLFVPHNRTQTVFQLYPRTGDGS